MRLERDERGLSAGLARGGDGVLDNVAVPAMHAVEAADGQSDRTNVARREPEMDLQLSTFSGTKVLRSGSVWPSATSFPSQSWART